LGFEIPDIWKENREKGPGKARVEVQGKIPAGCSGGREPEAASSCSPLSCRIGNEVTPTIRRTLSSPKESTISRKQLDPKTWVNFTRGDRWKWWRSKSETELRVIWGDNLVAVRQKKQTGLNLCGGDQAGLLFPHGGVWGSPGERTITP
jgi:hypothetical protein